MNKTENYNQFLIDAFTKYYPISENTIALLQSISKVQHLKKNELLLSIGKKAKEVHLLVEGVVVSYFLDKKGNTYYKNIFLEGNLVGSTVSYLKDQPSEFALEVIEDTIIISFEYKSYRKLIEENQDFKNFYIAYLENNWVIDKEKREIEIVMKDAKTRYLSFINQHIDIEKRIPLNYIASHLGITPTQLSRIRKDLKKNTANQHM